MVVLRDPGEVYVLRHSLGRRPLVDPVTAWVERVDPETLAVVERSSDLPAGPFWPGGLAAHADGSLHVVFGNHCHRLSSRTRAARDAPVAGAAALQLVRRPVRRNARHEGLRPRPARAGADRAARSRRRSSHAANRSSTRRALHRAADRRRRRPLRRRRSRRPPSALGRRRPVARRSLGRHLPAGRPQLRLGSRRRRRPAVVHGQRRARRSSRRCAAQGWRRAGAAVAISLDDPADWEAVEVCGLPHGAVTESAAVRRRAPDRRRLRLRQRRRAGLPLRGRLDAALAARALARRAHDPVHRDRRARAPRLPRAALRPHPRRRAPRGAAPPSSCAATGCAGCATGLSRDDVVVVDIETGHRAWPRDRPDA